MSPLAARIHELQSTLVPTLLNPASNIRLALLAYSIILVLLLLVLVVGLIFIMGGDSETVLIEPTEPPRPSVAEGQVGTDRKRRRSRWPLILSAIAVLLVVWVVAGYTTSRPALCKGCHWPAAEHAQAAKSGDPHGGTTCVSCHEPGGVLGRYVTGLPARALHLVLSATTSGGQVDYGQVTSSACERCHVSVMTGVTNVQSRGLKMSHDEPMKASATCTDCHQLRGGVVSIHNAGMTPCLRCHDGTKVSAACATCHNERPTAAARARSTSFSDQQVREIKCGGCHEEKRYCDPCHGLRMPHTTAFMAGAHARAATVDFWYNGGKACARCHTAKRRPCTRCHTSLIGKAHGLAMRRHEKATSAGCNTCHGQYAPISTRDFCKDVCHSKEAIATSSR